MAGQFDSEDQEAEFIAKLSDATQFFKHVPLVPGVLGSSPDAIINAMARRHALRHRLNFSEAGATYTALVAGLGDYVGVTELEEGMYGVGLETGSVLTPEEADLRRRLGGIKVAATILGGASGGSAKGGGAGLTTPSRFFGNMTKTRLEKYLQAKLGNPRSVRSEAKTFFNPKTGRSYNVHEAPGHQGGLPHVDVRTRGIDKDRVFFLRKGNP